MAWFNDDWTYRKKITIQSSQVLENLTDFPVLVYLSSDSDISSSAQSTGNDIAFTSSDGETQLSHEIEEYDNSTGELVAWVKVSSVSSSSDTDIFIYYGNSGAANQENAVDTWSNGFGTVHHLHNTTDGIEDSLGGFDGSLEEPSGGGTITQTTGLYGNALSFPGNTLDRVEFGVPPDHPVYAADITIRAWVNFDSFSGDERVFTQQSTGSEQDHYHMIGTVFGTNPRYRQKIAGTTDTLFDNTYTMQTGRWYLLVGRHDSSTGTTDLLLGDASDGTWEGVLVTASNTGDASTDTPIEHRIGTGTSTSHGIDAAVKRCVIDEVARSDEWLETEFNNHSDPSNFISLGSQETQELASFLVQDDFDKGILQSFWSENGSFEEANISVHDGYLEIELVKDGYDLDGYDLSAPRIEQRFFDTDFDIMVKFLNLPSRNDSSCGLVMSELNGTFLAWSAKYTNSELQTYNIYVEDGYEIFSSLDSVTEDPEYLRVIRRGDKFRLYYSVDGIDWILQDTINQSLFVNRVGIFGTSEGLSPADYSVQCDWFRVNSQATIGIFKLFL